MRINRFSAGASCALAAVVLVGCSSGNAVSPANKVTDGSNDVPFKACAPATCSGDLDGHKYQIVMPEKWNGSLIIYSPKSPSAVPGPEIAPGYVVGWQKGDKTAGDALVASGFALAGATTGLGGWQVDAQVAGAKLLHNHFISAVGAPNRTYVWGEGLGALSSANLGQQNDWVNGVASMCGLLAGVNPNFDIALDAAFAVKQLLYPQMKLAGYTSVQEAQQNYRGAMAAVNEAVRDRFGPGSAKISVIAAAAVVPTQTAKQSGGGLSGDRYAITQGLATILARSTIDRFAIEQQFGGNPSSNVGTDYIGRVSTKQQDRIDSLRPGATLKFLRIIQKGKRVSALPAARIAADGPGSGTLSDQPKVPTVTLHTEFDAVALVQNDSQYLSKAIAAGSDQKRLISVNITSPPTFGGDSKVAPYGAGHCNFTPTSIAGMIGILDTWVRREQYPTEVSIGKWLGSDSGFNTAYRLLPWPSGPTQP